jgi:hypothetical protein
MRNPGWLGRLTALLVAVGSYQADAGTPAAGLIPPAFFPIGLYCVEDPRDFPEIAAAGFNLVQGYRFEGAYAGSYANTETAARAYLDAAAQAGLRVLMGIPQELVWGRNLDGIRRRVMALRNHPVLFGWQLYDEPESPQYDAGTGQQVGPPLPPATLRQAYRTVKRHDPGRPVSIAVASEPETVRPYIDAADILMPDYFPVPFEPPSRVADFVGALLPFGKAVIPHIQAYNLAKDSLIVRTTPHWPWASARYPTREEMRFMAYSAIIRGAKGVIFNCYRFDYGDNLGGDDISPRANPSQWQAVASVATELKSMVPVLLAPPRRLADASLVASDQTPVELTVREHGGRTYLLTANASAQPIRLPVQLLPERFPDPIVTLLPEGSAVETQGGAFLAECGPYQVRLYEISSRP